MSLQTIVYRNHVVIVGFRSRASVVRELAAQRVVSLGDADAAAARLGVSRRQVYVLVGRWRLARDLSRTCVLALPAAGGAAGGCRMTWKRWSGKSCEPGT